MTQDVLKRGQTAQQRASNATAGPSRQRLPYTFCRAMAEAREKEQEEAEAKAVALAAKKGAHMRRVLMSQLYSPEKVEEAFDRDWAKLCHPVLQPIDKYVCCERSLTKEKRKLGTR